MKFKIEPIPSAITNEVRETMVSPQYSYLAATASIANGYGPCRRCLRVFDEGVDTRIAFTYNSFEGRSYLPDPGPVFIHGSRCQEFSDGFPEDILELPVLFEAFGDDSLLIRRTRMVPENVSSQLSDLLSYPAVKFVNLRNAEAGCFIARAVRN